MTNKDILEIAMKQSAHDLNCRWEDFLSEENKVVISRDNVNARKYLKLPFFCNLVSYGSNIVASVDEQIENLVCEYINRYKTEDCFETPNIHVLNEKFQKYGKSICFMAEYFLPDIDNMKLLPCKYEMKVLQNSDFTKLYTKEWSNALCENRKHLDVLGIGAYDGGKLIGLSGCSADCDTMWQVGIDVLPEYRREGVAAALTSRLVIEVLNRGVVPFYCAAWSNIKSVRNAIKSGFKPAWVEMTSKSNELVKKMNDVIL